MMDEIFRDMRNERWLIIYMDDIFIYTRTLLDNIHCTKRVLQRLRENDLFCKPEKCEFWKEHVEYLGLIIEENKLEMDPVKLKGIADWPPPTTIKEVRSFLGFGNYYRQFIPGYGDLTKPLNDLLKKDVKFEWTEEQQFVFEMMKKKFQESPVLQMPDPTKPFVLETDASKYASGAVLRQQDTNGDWHPCGYLSKSFNITERNYEIYDRELLAIIRALTDWRHYLMGSPHIVTILSDHRNLTYFRTAQKLNRRQARWSLYLSEFNVKLIHVPGKQMIQSDALSRRPDLCPDDDHDNEDKVLLSESMFINAIDLGLKDLIVSLTDDDNILKSVVQAFQSSGPFPLNSSKADWLINDDGLIFYQNRCYVPDNLDLRRNIVHRYHDTLPTGHPGQLRTLALIQRDYWWPGLYSFVRNYVSGCATCQQHKINCHPSNPPLQPIKSCARRPFSLITMDFITDLPLSDGFDSILVVVDHGSSKGVILEPCHKTIDAMGTASILLSSLYRRYGLPDKQSLTEDPNLLHTSSKS